MADRVVTLAPALAGALVLTAYRARPRPDGGPDDMTRGVQRPVADATVVLPGDGPYVLAAVVDGAWRYQAVPAGPPAAPDPPEVGLLRELVAQGQAPAPTDPRIAGALTGIGRTLAQPAPASNDLQHAARVGTAFNVTIDEQPPDPARQGLVGALLNPADSGVALVVWRATVSVNAFGAVRALRQLDAAPRTGAAGIVPTNRGQRDRASVARAWRQIELDLKAGVTSRGYYLGRENSPFPTATDDTAVVLPGGGSAYAFDPEDPARKPAARLSVEWVWREVPLDEWERQADAARAATARL